MPVGVLRPQGLRQRLACALGALVFAAAMAAQTKPAPAAASPAGTAQSKPAQTAAAGTAASKPPQGKPTDAAPKVHQATGTVASASAKQLVLIKQFGRNKVNWNFTLTPKTALDGKLAKAMRVRVYYHEEKGQRVAERVKVVEAAPAAAAPSKAAAAGGARATSQRAPTTPIAKSPAKPQSAP